MNRIKPTLNPFELDPNLTVREALERVLRLPSVASKRYLTNKVIITSWSLATVSVLLEVKTSQRVCKAELQESTMPSKNI